MGLAAPYWNQGVNSRQIHALAFARLASVQDPKIIGLVDTLTRSILNVPYESLSPNNKLLLLTVANMAVENGYVPGMTSRGAAYDYTYLAMVNAGSGMNLGAEEMAEAAYGLYGLLNGNTFNADGSINKTYTRGASESLVGLANAAFMLGMLKSNRSLMLTETIHLSNGAAANGIWSAISNNANRYNSTGQISALDAKRYLEIADTLESAYVSAATRQYASDNGITAEAFRAMSEADRQDIINKAKNDFNLKDDKTLRSLMEQVLKDSYVGFKDWKFNDGTMPFSDSVVGDQGLVLEAISMLYGEDYRHVLTKDSIEKIQKGVAEAMPRINENLAALSSIFLTDDFLSLLLAAENLSWGSLTSAKNVNNVRANLLAAYAMAAALNRDVTSILKEQLDLVNYESALVGGKQFVSIGHVRTLQRVRNAALASEEDNTRTSEEAVAAASLSYANTQNMYGNVALASYMIDNNFAGMPDSVKQQLLDAVLRALAGLADDTAEGAKAAEKADTDILSILSLNGLLDLATLHKRKAFKLYGDKLNLASERSGVDFGWSTYVSGRQDITDKSTTTLLGKLLFDLAGTAGEQDKLVLLDAVDTVLGGSSVSDVTALLSKLYGFSALEAAAVSLFLTAGSGLGKSGWNKTKAILRDYRASQATVGSMALSTERLQGMNQFINGSGIVADGSLDMWTTIISAMLGDETGTLTSEKWVNAKFVERLGKDKKAIDQSAILAVIDQDLAGGGIFMGLYTTDKNGSKVFNASDALLNKLGISREEFNRGFNAEDGGENYLRTVLGKVNSGYRMVATSNGMFVGIDEAMSNRLTADENRRFKAALALDWGQSLADRVISEDELSSLGITFNKQGVYDGNLDIFKGKKLEDILLFLNLKTSENGLTIAETLRDLKDTAPILEKMEASLGTLVTLITDISDMFKLLLMGGNLTALEKINNTPEGS